MEDRRWQGARKKFFTADRVPIGSDGFGSPKHFANLSARYFLTRRKPRKATERRGKARDGRIEQKLTPTMLTSDQSLPIPINAYEYLPLVTIDDRW